MIGSRLRDPWTCGQGPTRIERDGDDLESLWPELGPEVLPHGQVKTTASPRGPRDEQDLRSTKRGQLKRPATEVGQLELGRDRTLEGTTAGLRAECPQAVPRVMNERHRESFRGWTELDSGRVDGAEWHAALAAAQALGLRCPAGDALELFDRDA